MGGQALVRLNEVDWGRRASTRIGIPTTASPWMETETPQPAPRGLARQPARTAP
jgi:hypothetical protein